MNIGAVRFWRSPRLCWLLFTLFAILTAAMLWMDALEARWDFISTMPFACTAAMFLCFALISAKKKMPQ